MASETPGSTVSLVEQGSFLTKPSRHMVGCTGKESSTFTNPPDGLCPLCKNKGRSQVLKTYRINFTQSIFLCSDPQCIYPLGCTPLDNIITNTADLNSLSPNNQKKRNISELSSPSQSSAKRLKSDLPNLGQSSPVNASTSAQAESNTSVQIVPPWEHGTTSSGISQCAWTENKELTKQNVPETSSVLSSTSVLNSKPSSPLPPHGLHYNSPGSSTLFPAGQDRLYGEPPPSEDIKMIKLTSTDADNNTSMRLSETEGRKENEDKELSTPEPYPLSETPNSLNLVSENRFTLNGRSGILEDNEFSPGSVPSKNLPTLLHQHPLSLQMKDESTQEMCRKLSSGESAMPVCALGDMESDQPCDFLQNTTQNLCKSRESLLIPCADSVRNKTVALVDGSSAQDDQHRDLSHDLIKDSPSASSESPRLPVSEQDNKSEEILNQTSLKSLSEHSVEASIQENINNNPVREVEATKSLHSKQDSCGTTSSSYSRPDIQPTCLSDNSSVDAIEPPCNLTFVMKAIEELTAAPLKLVEDCEKMHIETTPSCHSVEDIQPELALEVDLSLNLPAISCTTDSVVDCSSGVRSEEDHLSDQDDLAGGFQQSHSETTTSTLVQDILPELQPQEKCLSDVPLTPSSSPSTHIDKNSPSVDPAEIILDTPMPDRLDMIYSCQKSVCNGFIPSHSVVQVTETEKDDCSLIGLCNTDCPVSEKDDISTEQEIAPLPDDPLLGAKKLVQDSVEPCEVSTPPRDIQAAITNQEHSTIDVASPNSTSALDDGDSAEIPASLPNCQIENNGNILPTSSQAEDQVEKEAHSLFDTVDAVEDIASRNQAAAPLSTSEESKGTVVKASFEDSVLPDLLLDIQPEHRMEEQLLAVPSPTCDADLNVTISADSKLPEEGNLLQVKLDKQSVQEVEMNKMEITNPEIGSDELQKSISLSDTLSSEGTAHNESGLLDLSVTEQSQAEEIRKPRTFENSQRVLQWKNRKSLCWLDCILSALVQSKTIGMFVAKHGNNKESIIHNLFAKYDEATAMCKLVIKKNKAGRPTKAETCLHEVRMDIFDKLKPLLKCELGQKESPVFALPLLLRLDPDYQKLFAHSFTWNFKCESCGYTYQERCQKIMTTFTNIKEDWRPLNAAHQSPCNQCQAKNQRREMHLETLQPMFMLHFVEGLPSSDLKGYSFQFGEHWYEIKTVIRYRDQHFSTWMENDDDTWLESDDLKGTFCRRHQKFRMRAEDIHIVIWERSNGKNIREEKPMPTSAEHVSEEKSENQISLPNSEISPSVSSMEFSLVAPEAKVSEPTSTEYSPQVALASECSVSDSTEHPSCLSLVVEPNLPVPPVVPVSVADNISNPLAGMESYAADDIITLTLVEIPFDSGGNPVDPNLSNPGVPQVEAALPETMLQPAVVEIQNTELTQHTGPGQSTRSDVAPTPVCNVQQIPVQPGHQNKISNLPPVAVATSTPSSKTFSTRKSVVDNMMGTLVKKDNFFINSNFSSAKKKTTTSKPWQPATLLKESDVSGAAKKADSFEGFQAKTVNNITSTNGSSVLLSKLLHNSSSFIVPKEKPAPSVNSFIAPAALGHAKSGKNGLSYGKMLAKDGNLGKEDKVKRLRLKLLKKLKAKKNELAMLEKMAKLQQNGSCAGEMGRVQAGSVNRREHLRGFLQELQEQIDNAETESIGTASSCTSICSSPGDAEFFAELFSPSPADHPENDSRFLEMLADGYGISADHNQQAPGFHYPMNNTTSQATSGADSIPNTLNQSSSGGEESLNLLSSSTMAMLNDDTGYLDSFVDIF